MNYAATTALLADVYADGIRASCVHKMPAMRNDCETDVHTEHDSLPDGVTRVRFASMVLLDKQEAFEACSIIASAKDRLATIGCMHEVEALANLFTILESRLLAI